MELNLINPEHKKNGKMLNNDSHKFEYRFLGVTVPTNRSVMLGSLSGSKLGDVYKRQGIGSSCSRILPASGYRYTYRLLFPTGTRRWKCLSTYVWLSLIHI